MTNDFIELHRYVLEQEFFSDKGGEIETLRTAIVSVIGDEPLDEFERRLAELDYSEYSGERFFSICAYSRAGRWNMNGARKIPDSAALGLIFITTQSDLALEELESEAHKYWDAGITPLIAWPGRTPFTVRMKRQLAQYDKECHFVSLKRGCTDQSPRVCDYWEAIVAYIEALLLPGTYPGWVCVDQADVRCVFSDCSSARILCFEADSFPELMRIVPSGLPTNYEMLGILVTLIGTLPFRLAYVHRVIDLVREKLPHAGSTVIFAALSDIMRRRYTLYVTICE